MKPGGRVQKKPFFKPNPAGFLFFFGGGVIELDFLRPIWCKWVAPGMDSLDMMQLTVLLISFDCMF